MYFPTQLVRMTSVIGALMLAIAGCGGLGSGGGGSPGPSGSTAYMNMALTDSPSQAFKQVNMLIKQVDLQDPDTLDWLPVATPNKVFNMKGIHGAKDLIGEHVQLPRKLFTKLRLTLGDGCNVVLLDGTVQALIIPDEIKASVVLDVNIDARIDLLVKVTLDIDIDACIQLVMVRGVPSYYFRPVVRIVNDALSGAITGVLRAKVTGEVLVNAQVFAEIIVDGHAKIIRTALTDQEGRYKLDCLPLGVKIFVVTRPFHNGVWFAAKATAALDLNAQVSLLNIDIDLDVDVSIGATIQGKVRPMALSADADVVALVKLLDCGPSGLNWLIVARVNATIDLAETFCFKNLAMGKFHLQSERLSCKSDGLCLFGGRLLSADVDVTIPSLLDIDINLNL